MNHSEMIANVSERLGIAKVDAKIVVEGVFESIAAELVKGGEVAVANFGKFKVKDVPARTGRNPATGAEIQIAASRKASFAPAKPLKDRLV